ncbi:MAG: helix-turn-helix domain-containing protein [Oscillospiraceae bacterium]|nr:helix-turn-helix domain-containing protein [Oscillospiraceae bacterium]
MDCQKVGALIRQLRKERHLTQKQLADALHISDKTVSKWECGMGCPDVTLLRSLSAVLCVPVAALLSGERMTHDKDGGNMNRIRFYHCPCCGNLMQTTGKASLSCCDRVCTPMTPQQPDAAHQLTVQCIEDDYYITFPHEMKKSHYITFVAYVTCNQMLFAKLYPEQGSEVRFPALRGGKLYFACNTHGLFVQDGVPTVPGDT